MRRRCNPLRGSSHDGLLANASVPRGREAGELSRCSGEATRDRLGPVRAGRCWPGRDRSWPVVVLRDVSLRSSSRRHDEK